MEFGDPNMHGRLAVNIALLASPPAGCDHLLKTRAATLQQRIVATLATLCL
jgi:hypothetical protein